MAAAPESALLVLVAVAGGGLTRDDLLALTGAPAEELDSALAAAFRAGLGRATSRWTGETVHVIADAGQRRQIAVAAGERATADCAAALHAWGESYRADGWPDNTPEYLLDGYFRLLKSDGDVLRMTACATNRARHARLRELTGGDVAAVHEVAACQAALAEQEVPDLAAAAVLAVLRQELTGRGDWFSTSLPAMLATAGDPIRADQLARSFTMPARRTAALTDLAVALLDEGRLAQARHTISELVSTVSELSLADEEKAMPDVVVRLAAAGQWTSAERIARAAPSRWGRVAALRALVAAQISAGHLDQAEHLALTLTADDGGTDGYSGDDTGGADRQALTSVIAALAADGQGDRAEQLARAFPSPDAVRDYGGVLALPTLAKALAVSGQDKQFQRLVGATPDWQNRNHLLATAAAAVAATGDAHRAEKLARSITDSKHRRDDALREVEIQLLAAGDAGRVESLARAIEETSAGDLGHAMYKPDRSETLVSLATLGYKPEVIRALVEQRQPDVAESVASRVPDEIVRAKAFRVLAVALAESGDMARAERLHEEQHDQQRNRYAFDGKAVLRSVTRGHLAAGDHNEALRTAHAARRLYADGQPLDDVTVWLIENGMTAHAERLIADPNNGISSSVAAAAYAAAGDAAAARRHARNAAKLPHKQKTQPLQPLPLLLFAEALVEAEEYDFARHLTERAIALIGSSNGVLLSRATIVLARTGAISPAEKLALGLSFWSHREPALEAVTLAYVAAGELDRAQSVVGVMDREHSHKVRAMVAVATTLTRAGDLDQAREVVAQAAEIARGLSYGQGSALLVVIRAQIEIGDIADAEQAASAIRDYVERQAARNVVNAARTKPDVRTAPPRVWQSAGPGEVPEVVAEAARWLKEAGDEPGATQLLAEAAEHTRAAEVARATGTASISETEPPAWICQLLARALCGIGRHWDFVLPSLAAVDRTVPLAVIEALGLHRIDEPGVAAGHSGR